MHMTLRRVDSEALVAGQIWKMRILWSAVTSQFPKDDTTRGVGWRVRAFRMSYKCATHLCSPQFRN
jgi:hypothetical protein